MKPQVRLYLIYMLLVAILLTGISLSRFSKVVSVGSYARVARAVFEYVPVAATLNGEPVPIEGGIDISEAMPGDVLVYDFEVRNHDGTSTNQVLLKYLISIAFDPDPSVLPLSYEIEPGGLYPPVGDGWVYMGFDEEITHIYTLTVHWDEGEVDPSHLNQHQEIQIKVKAEQVDSLG